VAVGEVDVEADRDVDEVRAASGPVMVEVGMGEVADPVAMKDAVVFARSPKRDPLTAKFGDDAGGSAAEDEVDPDQVAMAIVRVTATFAEIRAVGDT